MVAAGEKFASCAFQGVLVTLGHEYSGFMQSWVDTLRGEQRWVCVPGESC